jgi:predicted AAA+ superfamily ATPase
MTQINSYQVGGDHYASKAVQPWDAMESWMTKEAFAGYLHGNCIKYLSRYLDKNGVQDLKKCKHYLDKLIEIESKRKAMADNILQFQAGREAAMCGLTRDIRRSKDWLEGYDQVKAESND